MTWSDRGTAALLALAGVLMVVAIILVFGVAPDPVNLQTPLERYSQRIFYFHVPTWWVGFLAFVVAAGAGVLYLITRHDRWDVIGLSSVEIGITFTTMGLVTGSIWAKPTWGQIIPSLERRPTRCWLRIQMPPSGAGGLTKRISTLPSGRASSPARTTASASGKRGAGTRSFIPAP